MTDSPIEIDGEQFFDDAGELYGAAHRDLSLAESVRERIIAVIPGAAPEPTEPRVWREGGGS